MSDLKLKLGKSEYEGKPYTFLYVDLIINGVSQQIKLKPYSTFEKKLLESELSNNFLSIESAKK